MDDDKKQKITIPHIKRSNFVSEMADVVTVYGNKSRVTLLFSVECGDILSETFLVNDAQNNSFGPGSIQMLSIREDVARLHINKQTASFMLDQLKKILEDVEEDK